MKKFFLVTGIAAAMAMMAGCSNDETLYEAQTPKGAIGFKAFVNKPIKATEVNVSNIEKIYVYGYRGGDLIFNGQEVSVNGTNGVGTYSPIQYWEPGYTYDFEAIYPSSASADISFSPGVSGGTFTFLNNDGTKDILYAKADQRDYTAGLLQGYIEPVHFTMKHLLSRVKFTFKNDFPSNAAAKITIQNLRITNARTRGTITPSVENSNWSIQGSNGTIMFETDSIYRVASQSSGSSSYMFLMPSGQPGIYDIAFDISLRQGDVMTQYNRTVQLTLTLERGKSYNLVASLKETNIDPNNPLKPIEFTVEVYPWDEFTNTNTGEIIVPQD